MSKIQGRKILGIDGNWDHIWDKHGITETEVISVFANGPLQPKRNKRSGNADYMVMGRSLTGRFMKVCYSWDDERPGWIWIHTAF